MDIINLISKTPGMLDQLKSHGLSSDQIVRIGGEITQQLRADGDRDLTKLLAGMDGQGFIGKIDLPELIQQTGIDIAQAESIMIMLAPAVQSYKGHSQSMLGRLGSVAGSFFDKK